MFLKKVSVVILACLLALPVGAKEQPGMSLIDQITGNNSSSTSLFDQIMGTTESEADTPDGTGDGDETVQEGSETSGTETETTGAETETEIIQAEVTGAETSQIEAGTTVTGTDPLAYGVTKETVMVYMCGSTLEDTETAPRNSRAFASTDVAEMALSGFDLNHVNVILLAGGATKWALDEIEDGTTGLYQVKPDSIVPLLSNWEYQNMGSPETLSAFLSYAYESFPADRYSLIFWDHGSGSIGGLCHDVLNEDYLTMEELAKGLRESPFEKRKLNWVGFDACLMSAAEVAMVISPYAEYMVGSEESEPGYGWSYNFLKGLEMDADATQTCQRVIDDFFAFYEEIGYPYLSNLTLSCIDLTKYKNFVDTVDQYFASLGVTAENYPDLSRVRRNARAFGRSDDAYNDFDLVDLGNMVELLSQSGEMEAAAKVQTALDEVVTYQRPEKEGNTGLSVYFPFYNKMMYRSSFGEYKKLGFAPSYVDFISEFGNYLIANSNSGTWSNLLAQLNDGHRDTRTLYQLSLTEEQLAQIGMAQIIALQQSETGDAWHLVATQEAEITESGNLAGEYVHTNLFVVDADGALVNPVPLLYTVREEDIYLLHLDLIDSQGEVSPAELVCTQDRQSGELVVLEAYLYDTAIGAYSNRQTVSLDEYEEAVYQVVDRQMPQMDVLPAFEEWEVTSTTEVRFALGQGNHFAFVKDALEEDSLQVGFKITDVFNNVYLSHMAGIHRDLSDSDLESYMVEYDDDYVTLADVSITESGRLSGRLTNCMEEEVLIGITDLFINGREAELPDSVEIGGNGIFGGLENGESQILNLRLPLQEGENVDQISFILVLYDADTLEELAQDNVTILHEGGSEAKN